MNRSVRFLAIAAAAVALALLLVSNADEFDQAALAAMIGLILVATATTVHAVVRPTERRPTAEAYERSYMRVVHRMTRAR